MCCVLPIYIKRDFRLDLSVGQFFIKEKSLEFSHKLIRAFTHLSFPFPFDVYSLVVNKERERALYLLLLSYIYIHITFTRQAQAYAKVKLDYERIQKGGRLDGRFTHHHPTVNFRPTTSWSLRKSSTSLDRSRRTSSTTRRTSKCRTIPGKSFASAPVY